MSFWKEMDTTAWLLLPAIVVQRHPGFCGGHDYEVSVFWGPFGAGVQWSTCK